MPRPRYRHRPRRPFRRERRSGPDDASVRKIAWSGRRSRFPGGRRPGSALRHRATFFRETAAYRDSSHSPTMDGPGLQAPTGALLQDQPCRASLPGAVGSHSRRAPQNWRSTVTTPSSVVMVAGPSVEQGERAGRHMRERPSGHRCIAWLAGLLVHETFGASQKGGAPAVLRHGTAGPRRADTRHGPALRSRQAETAGPGHSRPALMQCSRLVTDNRAPERYHAP